MKIEKTSLEGCVVITPQVFTDHRGDFVLNFNKKEFEKTIQKEVDFVLENQSTSKYGVIRGLHLQKGAFAQAKLVRCIKGKILDVVVDFRKESPTYLQHFSVELTSKNKKQIFVPRGFLHGFSVLEDDSTVVYKCDNFYNPEGEFGIMYNDKTFNIDWKIDGKDVNLSEKDGKLRNVKNIDENEYINLEKEDKIVLTYGTFDLFHYGHIELLRRASKLGTKLIVGLSTDEFNLVKGKECKIPYAKRKELLESIEFVDQIIPESNWDQKIDDVFNHNASVFVMGDDWQGKFDFLENYCKVEYLPRTIDISTTQLKKVMNNK